LDEPQAAIDLLGDGLRHAPDQTELLVLRGGTYAQLRMYAEAADSARACYYLGETLNQAGDVGGARQALQRAVELDPRDAKAHHLLGRVLDRLGCPDEAREMYQRSRELAGA
jgi:Flp pilus assembly protein TadD